jgi:hypothetical protein
MYDRKASEFGVRPGLTDDERNNKYPKDAVQPVVRIHPITGRKCIYVCEGYTTRIVDIPARRPVARRGGGRRRTDMRAARASSRSGSRSRISPAGLGTGLKVKNPDSPAMIRAREHFARLGP